MTSISSYMFLYNNHLCLLTIINVHRWLLYLKFFDLYSYEKSYKLSCPIRPMSIHSNISTRWINIIFYLLIYPIQFISHMIYKIYSTPYSTIPSNLFTILLYSSRDIPISFLLHLIILSIIFPLFIIVIYLKW